MTASPDLEVGSVAAFDQVRSMVAPPLVCLTLTSVEGLVVTPMILGRRLVLNPVALFLGLFFWIWLWGVPGALLAVPLMAAFKIVCDRLPRLRAMGELMGP